MSNDVLASTLRSAVAANPRDVYRFTHPFADAMSWGRMSYADIVARIADLMATHPARLCIIPGQVDHQEEGCDGACRV